MKYPKCLDNGMRQNSQPRSLWNSLSQKLENFPKMSTPVYSHTCASEDIFNNKRCKCTLEC